MYKTVEKETKEINLEDLINGRPAALLHVHTAGMLALVTGEEEYPETLSFDEYRLDLLRAEYRYLCLSSSMLATLSNTVRHQQVVHYSHSSDHHQHLTRGGKAGAPQHGDRHACGGGTARHGHREGSVRHL